MNSTGEELTLDVIRSQLGQFRQRSPMWNEQIDPTFKTAYNTDDEVNALAQTIAESSDVAVALNFADTFFAHPYDPEARTGSMRILRLSNTLKLLASKGVSPYMPPQEDMRSDFSVVELNGTLGDVILAFYRPQWVNGKPIPTEPVFSQFGINSGDQTIKLIDAITKGRELVVGIEYWVKLGQLVAPFSVKGGDRVNFRETIIGEIVKLDPSFDFEANGIASLVD